jgi:L-aspartate oxidase
MAAVLADGDSFASHEADTLRLGCGLSHEDVVRQVVSGGPDAVERLLALGAQLDRDSDGGLELSREGGHSEARIIHAQGAATGQEIQRALTGALGDEERITSFPHTFVVDLLPAEEGGVQGALCRTDRGDLVAFVAPEVILATGGAGQIYRETTNPPIATGDGVAAAVRAGAHVRDLEFVQFHPTCLYIAGAARFLISEVVRGAGGILRDRHGVRFMPEFHPDGELAPRDAVSRAVFRRMVDTEDTSVYLDLSELDRDPRQLFPQIARTCGYFGIDISRDPIPVRPGAHYQIGGITVNGDGRSSSRGLWAVGECASSGLHGANRMGSNSLLEALVLGDRAGLRAARTGARADPRFLRAAPPRVVDRPPAGLNINISDITYSLKSLMWREMGLERNGAGLADAGERLAFWSRAVGDLAPPEPAAWELQNMLLLARLATHAALAREESRGVHFRTDHEGEMEIWRAHTELIPQVSGDRLIGAELQRIAVEPARVCP